MTAQPVGGHRAGRSVHVSVPATSANLGPGYDSLGLALSRRDDVRVLITQGGTRVRVQGEGAHDVPLDDSNLLVSTIRTTFDEIGFPQPGLTIECVNRIPHGRGLGSSAAAIVAGVTAARALAGRYSLTESVPARHDLDAVFAAAAGLEGHPDNVAACVYGGLTISWLSGAGPRAVRLDASAAVTPVVVVVDAQLPTRSARALLPGTVEHAKAAANLARSALLVAVLSGQADLDCLLDATADDLHQPYRAAALPRSAQLVDELRAAGVAAVISGAGPSVLALTTEDAQRQTVVRAAGAEGRVLALPVDPDGVRVHAASGG